MSLTDPIALEKDPSPQPLAAPGTASGGRYDQLIPLATVALPAIGTAYAGWLCFNSGISSTDIALLVGMYLFTILGVELGYHRYLTHHALKTTPWMRVLLVIAGAMAGHGPPVWWVAIHRRHHTYSDHDHDPHSPSPTVHGRGLGRRVAGAWHSHIGWMFRPQCTAAHSSRYARDLFTDRQIWWIDRNYGLWMLFGLAIPSVLGGLITMSWMGAWTGFIWGGLVRLFLGQHALWWGVITVCHMFGTRPFKANDDSCNNALAALIFLGDGWHNNHHAFPTSAKIGLRWWEVDITWWVVRALQGLGLAWDVVVPSRESIESKRRSV